ncbi:AraC family transcriptional regulator [Streptomyces sp. Ru71]|uniref:helix-turn-helix domain-containing protein n=1 Tax=Streptomyces sp. Ru71 TaxID=2080746 RepID=UPI000CDE1415|nr:helix-turn-helix domain-containing protein [Streptomyces sp. Ru71]POX56162.1 AraC family transcriptional regulator [Streptomyces sp. Ru71]
MADVVRERSGGGGPAGSWETVLALPHPRLRPGVLSYRGIRLALRGPRRRLEAPIGAATLVLGFEEPLSVSRGGSPPVTLTSLFCGPTTTAAVGGHGGRFAGVEVLLAPWMAFSLFGTPQHELADRVVHPDELPHGQGSGRLAGLAAALATLPAWPERFALLDEALAHWSAGAAPASARVAHAWAELARTGGTLPVPRLAEEVGWSVRQLENRFRRQIGLAPKVAARVLRLERARRLLAAGRGQAETAAACGFYDQAHLSGEFRAMTGCTPGQFAAARRLPPAGSPMADRISGEATSLLLPGGGAASPFSPSADFSKTRARR